VALPRIERIERRSLLVEEVERLATAAERYGTYVRTIGVPEALVGPLAILCEGLGRDDLVFTSPRGEPIRSRNFHAGCGYRRRRRPGSPA
jgi:hypothetical protein